MLVQGFELPPHSQKAVGLIVRLAPAVGFEKV